MKKIKLLIMKEKYILKRQDLRVICLKKKNQFPISKKFTLTKILFKFKIMNFFNKLMTVYFILKETFKMIDEILAYLKS